MRCRLVAGNWKMNGSRASTDAFIAQLIDLMPNDLEIAGPEMALFPPSVYLGQVVAGVSGANVMVKVGAQNLHAEHEGAFTGEVSAEMVREAGATLALVGHSERRALFGETDAEVAAKFQAAQRAGLIPVLCVGESLEQREAGDAQTTVLGQLGVVLDTAGVAAFESAIVAYEPVWAIGTGRTATPEDAQAMHQAIRRHVAGAAEELAENLRILYGGSVNADNAQALFAQEDVDGGLVGGASLNAGQFVKILEAARA